MVVALLAARFLLPTEASVEGETLWLVQLWTAAAIIWAWRQLLAGRRLFHGDALTIAVALLVVGHVLSGAAVLVNGGDKRAALNMMWEWAGLGIIYLLVRTVVTRRVWRVRVTWGLSCIVIALAGYGLYQHYVWYPRMADEYRQKRQEWDRYADDPQRSPPAELQRWFVERNIAVEGPGRELWESRLTASTEPFGTFGLANTFAGLLVAFLFPLAAMLISAFRRRPDLVTWMGRGGLAVGVVLVLWCLILTKSRTAWVGGGVGTLTWWLTRRRAQPNNGDSASQRGRKWAVPALGGAVVVAVLGVAVLVTGGVDREVVSEAPKSLQYRFQYWTATADVLQEFPFLGTGPGNFRQHYLKYKLPASSEEIQDPHNLFLDVWCSGGLVALAGLLLLIGLLLREAFHRARSEGINVGEPNVVPKDDSTAGTGSGAVFCGMVAAFLLVLFAKWFVADSGLDVIAGLLLGAMTAGLITLPAVKFAEISPAGLLAACAALLTHLSGAGGIEMPAMTQVVFLLAVGVLWRSDAADEPATAGQGSRNVDSPIVGIRQRRREFVAAIVTTAAAAAMFGACLATATIPVVTREAALSNGRAAWRIEGRYRTAERYLKTAALNDPLSPKPTEELARMTYGYWRSHPAERSQLDRAVSLQRLTVELDPHNFRRYWTLGRWLRDDARVSGDKERLNDALDAYASAVERYPTNALLLAEYAEVLKSAGRERKAQTVARRAVSLDELNRREGHTEKLLPASLRKSMQDVLKQSP